MALLLGFEFSSDPTQSLFDPVCPRGKFGLDYRGQNYDRVMGRFS